MAHHSGAVCTVVGHVAWRGATQWQAESPYPEGDSVREGLPRRIGERAPPRVTGRSIAQNNFLSNSKSNDKSQLLGPLAHCACSAPIAYNGWGSAIYCDLRWTSGHVDNRRAAMGKKTANRRNTVLLVSGDHYSPVVPSLTCPNQLLLFTHQHAEHFRSLDQSTDKHNSKTLLKQVRRAVQSRDQRKIHGCFILRWCVVANMPAEDLAFAVDFDSKLDVFTHALKKVWTNGTGPSNGPTLAQALLKEGKIFHELVNNAVALENDDSDAIPVPASLRPMYSIADIIRGLIIRGRIPVGDTITKRILVEGANGEREAILAESSEEEIQGALELVRIAHGLVKKQGGGFLVRDFPTVELESVVDMRELLETHLILQNASSTERRESLTKKLETIAQKMETTCEAVHTNKVGSEHSRDAIHTFGDLDMDFHLALCRNQKVTQDALTYLLRVLRTQRVNFCDFDVARMAAVIGEHRQIIEELKSSPFKVRAVRFAVSSHIRKSWDYSYRKRGGAS